jgi:hypothetical protein
MTIRKGEQWGRSVPRPERLTIAASDPALSEMVAADSDDPVGVSGGDLFRTVGAPGPRDSVMRLPIDVVRVVADGRSHIAVAHVVARRSWWRGGIVAIMNVDHLGAWNVAPRAHPNDGRFDVVEVDREMTVRERIQARGRLEQGTHLPHPRIATRTGTEATWHFERPQQLWIDGVHAGSVHDLAVEIEADRFAIHV